MADRLHGKEPRMQLRLHLAAIAALLVALPAAAATEQRPVSGFHALAVSVPAHVTVMQGAAEDVALTADDDVIAKIETVVEEGVLRIRFPRGVHPHPAQPIAITVHVRSLDSV